ncbi:MAG: hypothetical protein KME04_14540 [Pleurocapsa minor GSE-CHR-MK-17-07R]|nr:hypothetical protein [Pleurocapsa minor GSE-CHR-MK 17-07R]
MNTYSGVWIDHRQAVIVSHLNDKETVAHIHADVEKHVRYSGHLQPSRGSDLTRATTEDGRERRHENDLHRYYDEVIALLKDADEILILGPGEARDELRTRMEHFGLGGRIAAVRSADKLTEGQIAAEVRGYFEDLLDTTRHAL